jgi:hypothetical protein
MRSKRAGRPRADARPEGGRTLMMAASEAAATRPSSRGRAGEG